MANYRFLSYDLRSNVALEELPLSIKEFGGRLNGAGPFRATMPVEAASARLLMAATIPERTIVYVERDGVLVEGFIVWERRRRAGRPVEISGASLPSYWRRNNIRANLTYAAADQFAIARGIVDHLQTQAGANIGIVTGSATCGVTRDRTYYGYERKNVGDAIAELGAVDNGFDWSVDVAWVAGVPTKTLNLSYPRRGRLAGTTGVVFETGKNVIDYDYLEDGTRSARTVDALGAGDGNDMLISTSTDTALIDAGYPLTAETISHKDVSIQATLDAHALAARRARATTPTFLQVEIDPADIDAGLGTWIVGDDVLVKLTDENFPQQDDGSPGLASYWRVLAYDVNLPDNGPETVKVVLGSII